MPGPRRVRRALIGCALMLTVAFPLLSGMAATQPVGTPDARRDESSVEVDPALRRAEHLLAPTATATATAPLVPRAAVHTPSAVQGDTRGDLTLALLKLSERRSDLPADQQRRAARLLSRPVTDSALANDAVVVHYNAAQTALGDAQATLDTVSQVRNTYLNAGYRAPRTDGVAGGDARFDVYLSDLTPTSAYGYCTSDQPVSLGTSGRADRWAFCVLDNDYRGYAGASSPAQLRQVTIAHEYFHAVQFAYDAGEDGWFMEGTAVWMEDELFDDVDDNLQYVPFSPLARPDASLDVFDSNGYRQYGTWLFFRWLSERFPDTEGGLPSIVRDMWQAADSTTGDPARQYSLNAVASVLKARGLSMPKAFALFADANRRPAQTYSEGAVNAYPTAPLAAKIRLDRVGASASRKFRLNHLSSATTRFVPKGTTGASARLRIDIDMASKRKGSVAVVSAYRRDRTVSTRLARLDSRGDTRLNEPFSTAAVSGVEVTLVNASKRYRDCFQATEKFACFGRPMDQKVLEQVRATVLR